MSIFSDCAQLSAAKCPGNFLHPTRTPHNRQRARCCHLHSGGSCVCPTMTFFFVGFCICAAAANDLRATTTTRKQLPQQSSFVGRLILGALRQPRVQCECNYIFIFLNYHNCHTTGVGGGQNGWCNGPMACGPTVIRSNRGERLDYVGFAVYMDICIYVVYICIVELCVNLISIIQLIYCQGCRMTFAIHICETLPHAWCRLSIRFRRVRECLECEIRCRNIYVLVCLCVCVCAV